MKNIITLNKGVESGIGKAMSETFAESGATVHISHTGCCISQFKTLLPVGPERHL